MFVRLCPYFPFSARVCLNQHHWLATQMRAEGRRFRQESNAFLTCSDPARLQALADSLTAPRHRPLCAEMAAGLHAVLHADGAADGELSASALLCAS